MRNGRRWRYKKEEVDVPTSPSSPPSSPNGVFASNPPKDPFSLEQTRRNRAKIARSAKPTSAHGFLRWALLHRTKKRALCEDGAQHDLFLEQWRPTQLCALIGGARRELWCLAQLTSGAL